ncbi:potassium-transporting ATPase subunit C [Hydrotalea sp.]|uniref:potassium-transporting ATPase subunit C n=1 Tax=Hydrotalea sp. TaxID=2881279 RepID=UPI002605AA4E|nr:potassium-transporting ATPase subunit C [Hydrotalea sp.]
MKNYLLPAIRLTLVCLLLFSVLYTTLVWCVAQITPDKGEAAIWMVHGRKMYRNIGQKFSDDKYFWSRPSAVNYNAAAAGASNKGPNNSEYLQTVQQNIDSFQLHHPGTPVSAIPSDLVTASGSGLDPNISVQSAYIQITRIAQVRQINPSIIETLVHMHIQKPLLGIFGPESVNVLELNIALDSLTNH